jgi:uncharacterized protein DUF4242
VAEFLLELYVARGDPGAVEREAARARDAADTLRSTGTTVRYVRSIYIPEDETCFLVYETETRDAVRDAAERAELPGERILETEPTTT